MPSVAGPTARFQRICVYAGSGTGARPQYAEVARTLGELLAAREIGIVYGGAHLGLMGVLADAALAGGGEVVGVIPGHLVNRELAHSHLTELRVVDSMHERKALMAELSDAFIALPGGIGTLEELIEMLTWAQLGLHDKPLGLLDVQDYYAHLSAFLDVAVREQFLSAETRELLCVATDPAALLAELAELGRPLG